MQSEYKQKQVEALTLVESMKLEAQPIGSPWVGSSLKNLKVGKKKLVIIYQLVVEME